MKFYKIVICLFLILSCSPIEKKDIISFKEPFANSGFALVFEDKLYESDQIKTKLDDRSYIIFQRNLKSETNVIIKNLLNGKTVLATVGKNTKYPNFYNSVISKRIADELELSKVEPYIDEEKNVAEKAPVLEIGIKDLSNNKTTKKITAKSSDFKYVIKLGDFYFYDTALMLKKRVRDEFNVSGIKINKLSKTQFRVYLGPYKDLNSLKNAFNNISVLNFENIEIIKI